jgi:hypothetical protein
MDIAVTDVRYLGSANFQRVLSPVEIRRVEQKYLESSSPFNMLYAGFYLSSGGGG